MEKKKKKTKQLKTIAATFSYILYLPEHAFDLFIFLGFRFLVWIPSFFIARGRGTWKN